LWALKWQMPLEVSGKILAQSEAVNGRIPTPTEFTAELTFADGVTAGFYCSFYAARQQWMIVGGQKGYLAMPDFVRPLDSYAPAFNVNDKQICLEMPERCPSGIDPGLQGHPYAQDTLMFRNFAQQVASGQLQENWPEWALKTQMVQDACLASARLGTPVKL
jgi:predicted dehydrogenase